MLDVRSFKRGSATNPQRRRPHRAASRLDERDARLSTVHVRLEDYLHRDDPERSHRIYDHLFGLDLDSLVHIGNTVSYDKARPFGATVELARFRWNLIYGLPAPGEFHRLVACSFEKDDHDTLKDDCQAEDRSEMHEYLPVCGSFL